MHRISLCLLVSLISACIVHAVTPPAVGQYEIRKRTADGYDSYGVTLTNGQAIGQSGGIPAAVTVGGGSGTGTVTSVALTLPGIFSVTGSPITESGTLAASLATQTANRVWAGPTTGSAAAPTFRVLVSADIPDLSGVYQPLSSALTTYSGIAPSSNVQSFLGATNYAAMRGLLSLGNVENTALSTWTGSTNIVNLGTISVGTWQGNAIDDAYISSAATWTAKESALTFSTGLTRTTNTITVNTTQNIGRLSNLTTDGFVKTSGSNGTLSIDTSTYQPLSGVLTSLSGVSNAAGLLYNSGSGPSEWVGINIGGHGSADTGKIVQFGTGGNLATGDSFSFSVPAAGGGYDSSTLSVPATLSYNWAFPANSGTVALTSDISLSNLSGLGTGVATALAINTGSAGAPVLFNGVGGTPSSIVLTNASGTASNLTAGSASTLATGRTIAITGDLTWTSPSFNGSANVTAAGTLASTGVTAGSYTSADITVDAKGRITAAANGSGGGGGLTGFTGSLATTSPNNTVNASMLAASGGTTNQDAVIAPKGTGALIGFGIPDNTGTGGAKRGDYAVDFQGPFRNNSADIASGSSSAILGGRYNKATGSYALAFGYQSAATGSVAPIALGYQSTASASYAAAIGGVFNNASGASSSAIGGQSNTASGANAAAFGGQSNTASASYAYAFGYYSVADRYGMQAKASGQFAAAGDAQAVQFILRCKTTTNAAVEMKLDGSSTRLTIPAGKALYGTVKIIGMKSDGSVAATYTRQVAIKNAAGTTSLIGTVNTLGTDEAGSTSISITADDTNDALNISPTGITSETWRWVAVFEGVEIAYGS